MGLADWPIGVYMSWYVLQLWLFEDGSSPIEDIVIVQAKNDSDALTKGIEVAKRVWNYTGDAGTDAGILWGDRVDTTEAFFTVKELEVGYIAEMLTEHKLASYMDTATRLAFIKHAANVLNNREALL